LSAKPGGILIGLLVIAFVAVAVFSVAKISDLSSQVSDLEDQISAVEGQAAKLAKSTGNDAGDALQALEHKLKKVEACIPEVQNEINGLEVEPQYGYIENNSQVSAYCYSVVYPPQTRQGG
jgi:outer membrane murein-binding lipoprotein Lpp